MSIGLRLRQEIYLKKQVIIEDTEKILPYILMRKGILEQLPKYITKKRIMPLHSIYALGISKGEIGTVEAIVDVKERKDQVLVISILRKRKRRYFAILEKGVRLVNDKRSEVVAEEENKANINLR